MRTVKQSSVVRETENGEEGEEEGAEFGEEDLFHQQVEVPKVACVAAVSPGPRCPAGRCVCAKVLGTVRASPPGGPHSLWPEMGHGGAGGGGGDIPASWLLPVVRASGFWPGGPPGVRCWPPSAARRHRCNPGGPQRMGSVPLLRQPEAAGPR